MASRSFAVMSRLVLSTATLCAVGAAIFITDSAHAEERKFLIFLANMQRSFVDTDGLPCSGEDEEETCPTLEALNRSYFRVDPDDGLGTFAEYWEEVSYGIVRIDGRSLGIVELPWPQYPIRPGDIQTTAEDVEDGDIDEDFSPATVSDGAGYFDINFVGDFQYGEGERVREDTLAREAVPLYKTDFNSSAGTPDEVNAQYPGTQQRASGFDNITTVTTEDLDNDGRLDLGVEDIDGDGRFDLRFEDTNGNCVLDFAVSEDCTCPAGNCNGIWEPGQGEDCNGNGIEDVTSEDLDNDNHLDVGEDTNCNGCLDPGEDLNRDGALTDNEDLDNDGNFDFINEDADSSCTLVENPSTCCDKKCEDVEDWECDNSKCETIPAMCPPIDDGGLPDDYPECCPTPTGFIATLNYDPIWTPGERFRDIDGDEAYDALFEPAVNFDTTPESLGEELNCYNDANGQLRNRFHFADINGNEIRNLPEPLEDFIVFRISNIEGFGQFGAVDTDYIRRNYPGNVPMLLNRIGNRIYDSPDNWDDVETTTVDGEQGETSPVKLERDANQPSLTSPLTPEPSWFKDFWAARYGVSSASDPVLEWQTEIPNMVEYAPPPLSIASTVELNFAPNAGGNGGWGTVFEQMLHIRPAFTAHVPQNFIGVPLKSPDELDEEKGVPIGYVRCPPSEDLDPENPPICSASEFDYNCTEHIVGYLDEEAEEPVIVRLRNDVLHGISLNGYNGCIDPDAAFMRPFDPKMDYAAEPCDFDGDGESDSFVFTDLPPYIGEGFGPLVNIDGDDIANDIIFTHPIAEANEPPQGHPECGPTGMYAGECMCIAYDVDPFDPFNEECCPGGGLVPEEGCPGEVDPVDCFVPECESRYCPIPRFLAPETDEMLGCTVVFNRRFGDGTPLADLDDNEQDWPGWNPGDDGDEILPPANLVYDGPKEYDDLASSIYHTQWAVSTNPEAPCASGEVDEDGNCVGGDTNGDGTPDRVINLNYGGDLTFGEVTTTSPFESDRNRYGHDQGGFTPTAIFPDTYIVPAGPLAGGDTEFLLDGAPLQPYDCQIDPIHGSPGFDGGNVMNLEFLTWRIDGTAPTEPLDPSLSTIGYDCGNNITANEGRGGFRDFNLDGMLDLGEGRAHGTENYVIDSLNGTRNDGMDELAYPHNRDRLTEDVIEFIDFSEDLDIWINPPTGCVSEPGIHHMVILPPGLPSNDPFAVTAPNNPGISFNTIDDNELGTQAGCDQPVRAELIDMIKTTTFTNLAASFDRNGESNLVDVDSGGDNMTAFAAHEFGHYWECWPDLYDYDVFAPGELTIEQPIGRWDLMAGSGSGLVHVIPPFKQFSGWIQAIDLRTVLTPGVPQQINFNPIEVLGNSYYYYENPVLGDAVRQERFYFFHLENQGEFSSNLPWDFFVPGVCSDGSAPGGPQPGGMMMLHTDLELTLGGGGANQEGLPQQQRIGSHFAYVYEQADGLHRLEQPLQFGGDGGDAGDPFPGVCDVTKMSSETNPDNTWWASGLTQPVDSGIEVTDLLLESGGSSPTFLWFPQEIPTLRFLQPPGGQSIGSRFPVIARWSDINAGTGLKLFAQLETAVTLDDRGACVGGDCYDSIEVGCDFGPCTDGYIKKATPGNSSNSIDVNAGALEDGFYRFFGFLDPAQFSPGIDGKFEKDHTTPIFSDLSRRGTLQGDICVEGVCLDVTDVELDPDNPNSARLEGWTVTYVGDDKWEVCGSLSGLQTVDGTYVACEDAGDYTGQRVFWETNAPARSTVSPPGAVTFRVLSTAPMLVTQPPDRFTYATTGFTPYSEPVEVVGGEIDPGPKAIIDRSSNEEGCPNMCFPGVRIRYDGSESLDSDGTTDGIVEYRWDIDSDNGPNDPPDAVGAVVEVTYDEPGTYSITLTVVEGGTNRTGTATLLTDILNRPPVAEFTATPDAGQAPLLVTFDASGSTDADGDVPLRFEWDFDYDGINFDPDLGPTVDPVVERSFEEGSFNIALRAIDSTLNESELAVQAIHSGNRPPTAVLDVTPNSGSAPLTVVFDGSGSSDPDDDTLTYTWDFGDGNGDTGDIVTHTYDDTGLFQASLEVDDGNGGTSTAGQVIQVILGSGNVITADMTASPSSGPSPLRVTFTAIASDTNGEPLSYRWDFKDGNLGFGQSVSHTYMNDTNDDIVFNPVLVVSDPNGTQATATRQITVMPEDDTGGPSGPANPDLILVFDVADDSMLRGTAPLNVLFDTRGSRGVNGAEFESIEVDFGDGTSRSQPTPGLVSHTYNVNNGQTTTYTARATMVGTDGTRSTDTLTIQVFASQPPVASFFVQPLSGPVPLAVVADASDSRDPEGSALTYVWNMGDGSGQRFGQVVNHTYSEVGNYIIELTVTDATGASDSTTSPPINATVSTPDDGGGGLPPGQEPPDDEEPPSDNPCGIGCGATGAGQLLFMLIGLLGLKTVRRRW